MIFGSWDGHAYGLDGANGTVVWTTRLGASRADGGGVASTPRLSPGGDLVYMGGPDGVWALETRTGAVRWHYYTGAMVGSSPAVRSVALGGSWNQQTTVYVGGEDGFLYALRG